MTRQYGSFMIRCWTLGDNRKRYHVEHIQHGEQVRCETLAEAMAWIEERCGKRLDLPSNITSLEERGLPLESLVKIQG